MRSRLFGSFLTLTMLGACGPDDDSRQPPVINGLAIGEQGSGRFRLAAMANGADTGVLRCQWQAIRGTLDTPEAMQTMISLPLKAGAFPVRLTVQDGAGGQTQALFVILHDPVGQSEIAPVTLASFKRGQLRAAQTQLVTLHRGTPLPSVSPPPPLGLRLLQTDISPSGNTLAFSADVQTDASAGIDATSLLATWSALGGTFDQAAGLKASWHPSTPSGLEAVTLSVGPDEANQAQLVMRLVMEQGTPRENRLDMVTIRDGRLSRQVFSAIPSPRVTILPSAGPRALPTPAAPTPAPTGIASSSSPKTSGTPPAPAAAPPMALPTATGSPPPSAAPATHATVPPSSQPPGANAPIPTAPSPSFTPYDPLATPTPKPSASPSL